MSGATLISFMLSFEERRIHLQLSTYRRPSSTAHIFQMSPATVLLKLAQSNFSNMCITKTQECSCCACNLGSCQRQECPQGSRTLQRVCTWIWLVCHGMMVSRICHTRELSRSLADCPICYSGTTWGLCGMGRKSGSSISQRTLCVGKLGCRRVER